MPADFSLQGKTALITGASRGIGAAIAIAFAEHGADVALVARSVEGLEQTAKEVANHDRRSLILPCDVTSTSQVEEAVARTISEFGGFDILVNNAGGTRFMSPLVSIREDGWNKVIELNLNSVFRVCKAAGPHLMEREGASVINIASVDGLRPAPVRANYSAAKAGVLMLTQVLALEWAELGVRVNSISPGTVDTEIWGRLSNDEDFVNMTKERIPMRRWAEADEIAGCAVFLASNAASYVTGANFVVDGGISIRGF